MKKIALFSISIFISTFVYAGMSKSQCEQMGGLYKIKVSFKKNSARTRKKVGYCRCKEENFYNFNNESRAKCQDHLKGLVISAQNEIKLLSKGIPIRCEDGSINESAVTFQRVANFCSRYKVNKEEAIEAEQRMKKSVRKERKKRKNGNVSAMTYRQDCPSELEWRDKAAQLLCNDGEAKDDLSFLNEQDALDAMPEAQFFFVDGFGDFNAQQAKGYPINAVNIGGYEPADFSVIFERGNANGLSSLKSWVKNARAQNPIMSKVLSKTDFHYHNSDLSMSAENPVAAINCIKSTQKDFDDLIAIFPATKRPKLIIGGFSNGGASALTIQEQIGQEGIETDLLLTLDPVERGVHGYLLQNLDHVHERTKRAVNIYQDIDYGSFAPVEMLKIRSSEVQGSYNIKVAAEDASIPEDGRGAHYKISQSQRVRQFYGCEIANLFSRDGEKLDCQL